MREEVSYKDEAASKTYVHDSLSHKPVLNMNQLIIMLGLKNTVSTSIAELCHRAVKDGNLADAATVSVVQGLWGRVT